MREAFFPSSRSARSIEPAAAAHRTEIAAILERHDSAGARDEHGIAGFYVSLEASQLPPELRQADPMSQACAEHLRTQPMPGGQSAILIRRWLGAEAGEAPSPVQAECWLDGKRTYLEMRAALRRRRPAPRLRHSRNRSALPSRHARFRPRFPGRLDRSFARQRVRYSGRRIA
ncbi:MAG: hypothetical protein NTV52_05585 [Acidobacteria bacterium]|nr:hypothetical protein [Acidobacteriota bacterium]